MITYSQYLKGGGLVKKYQSAPGPITFESQLNGVTRDNAKERGFILNTTGVNTWNFWDPKNQWFYYSQVPLLDFNNNVPTWSSSWKPRSMRFDQMSSDLLANYGVQAIGDEFYIPSAGGYMKYGDRTGQLYNILDGTAVLINPQNVEANTALTTDIKSDTDVKPGDDPMLFVKTFSPTFSVSTYQYGQKDADPAKDTDPTKDTTVPVVTTKTATPKTYGYQGLMGIAKDSDEYNALTDALKGAWQQAQDYKTAQGNWKVGNLTYYTWNGYNTAAQLENQRIQAANAAKVEAGADAETERLIKNRAELGTSGVASRQFNAASQAFTTGPAGVASMSGRQLRRTLKAMNKAKAAGQAGVDGKTYTDFFTQRKNNGVTGELTQELTVQPEVKELDWNAKFKQGGLLSYADYLKY